jgi:hypothetical protein
VAPLAHQSLIYRESIATGGEEYNTASVAVQLKIHSLREDKEQNTEAGHIIL